MKVGKRMAPGTVVSVPWVLGVRHVGLVTERLVEGRPTVISNSKRDGVVEETWHAFCDGHLPQVESLRGPRDGRDAIAWARTRIGRSYDLFDSNCEHFVRDALGLPRESPQLRAGMAMAGLVLIAVAASRR